MDSFLIVWCIGNGVPPKGDRLHLWAKVEEADRVKGVDVVAAKKKSDSNLLKKSTHFSMSRILSLVRSERSVTLLMLLRAAYSSEEGYGGLEDALVWSPVRLTRKSAPKSSVRPQEQTERTLREGTSSPNTLQCDFSSSWPHLESFQDYLQNAD